MTTSRMVFLLASAVLALTSGCAAGPDFRQPDSTLQHVVLEPKGPGDPGIVPDPVPQAWWTLFKDATLDALLARAWDANLDMQAAAERLMQMRARSGIASAGLLPRLGVAAGYARSGLSEHGPLAALGAGTAPTGLWQGGFDMRWEIDLWNRQGRARESALAQVQASAYDRQAVRVALAAEIARTYLSLRGIQERLNIVNQNRAIAENLLRLAESRRQHGVATRLDQSAAGAQLAALDASIPELTRQQDMLMNALALATGAPPRGLDQLLAPTAQMPLSPASVPVGLPSALAQRRPDIQGAAARLHAATAEIGVAQADFYPRITLFASAGAQAFDEADLGKWSARQFSVGPAIYLPLFEGGKLKRTLELTQSRQRAAAIDYRKTVLLAWHEINNALNARVQEQRRHVALEQACEQSRQALDVARQSYRHGVADHTAVLMAQRSALSDQMALNDSTTAIGVSLVALYKALGGGWNPDAPDSPQQDAGPVSMAAAP